ncbi:MULTISPECIES: alpha/beta fold hydrolase [unclassified Phycicoccus]|uniref:alpha/beta fold hydrolase n=1 Tax=unclassified Phycicoccus TaxID=2637926 RepID=UPI0007039E4F|nr:MULTISPECIES: alpha/beta hydrolase [unclassified Phycicoccus]KRF26350.1 alpha/beta hydrolase [Phycicoccus sp. Soil803]KRF29112.1 alpha/beta hydrolase [Phycicoccus sp. Soil802]
MSLDASMALMEGPWEHRFVAANGARFHVAEQGEGPIVLLLHGFPQFWWAWRHQMAALAEAGYRACAMDLRGYGASDKPPRGYDTRTSATDVASVLRSLGGSRAVVVGHGWGGWIAWSMPTLQPTVTRAIASLSMPHPLVFRKASFANLRQLKANAYLGGLQRPFVPERQMTVHGGYVQRLLREWASPEGIWPSPEEARIYSDAMALPFVAHSAAEYYRWVVRSQVRPDGWKFAARMKTPINLPVLQLHGEHDGAVLADPAAGSAAYVTGRFERHLVPNAGHFLPEEAPDVVNQHLLDWLGTLR